MHWNLKIKPVHYHIIKNSIERVTCPHIALAYSNAGLSDMRYRWDMLRKTKLTPFICDTLYPYLDDTHIDSALRRIFGHSK